MDCMETQYLQYRSIILSSSINSSSTINSSTIDSRICRDFLVEGARRVHNSLVYPSRRGTVCLLSLARFAVLMQL